MGSPLVVCGGRLWWSMGTVDLARPWAGSSDYPAATMRLVTPRLLVARLRSLGLLPALFAVGCGPAVAPPVPPVPKAIVRAEPKVTTPSRWVLHPQAHADMTAKLDLGDGKTLYVGDSGERWLHTTSPKSDLVAAATIAPEAITTVMKNDGEFVFVGATGTTYVAKEPLAELTLKHTSPTKMRSLAAGKTAIMGVSNKGLWRSVDSGKSWNKVDLPSSLGVITHVAMQSSGLGLALVMPQRLYATADDGATWTAIASPGIGARSVVADDNGDVLLEGLTASAMLRTGPLRLEKLPPGRLARAKFTLPGLEASAGVLRFGESIRQGRAAVIGDKYVEVAVDPDESTHWLIAITPLADGRPATKRLAQLDGCSAVLVAANANTIFLGCQKERPPTRGGDGSTQVLKILRSDDLGLTWKDDGSLLTHSRDREEHRLFALPDGSLIFDGGCKRTRDEYMCGDSPPVIRVAGAKTPAKVADGLQLSFLALATSADGARAYAVGKDTNGKVAFYVSNNGGHGFTRKSLPAFGEMIAGKSLLRKPTVGAATIGFDLAGHPVALVSTDGDSMLRYVTEDEGATFKVSRLPFDVFSVDMSGVRGLALEAYGSGGFETADGGVTWTKVGVPTPNGSFDHPQHQIACFSQGCLVGMAAARIGWDLTPGVASSSSVVAVAKPDVAPVGRTLFACRAEGAYASLGATLVPDVAHADLGGGVRWAMPHRDMKTGEVNVRAMVEGKKGPELKTIGLVSPNKSDAVATAYNRQLEGVAALRYSFKRDPLAKDKPKTARGLVTKQTVDVEVSWWVAETNKIHRATIKNAGSMDPSKDLNDREVPVARFQMLSIASSGIHVRPFMSAGPTDPWFFVSNDGKVEKLSWPEIPARDAGGSAIKFELDAVRVGKRSILFGHPTYGAAQLWIGSPKDGGFDSTIWGVWSRAAMSSGGMLRFVDSGPTPLLGLFYPGSADHPPAAFGFTPSAEGKDPSSIIVLPTQATLSDPEPACEKLPTHTYRMVTPYSPGTRHAVRVSIDGSEKTFATDEMVIRPTASGACAGAIEAHDPAASRPAVDRVYVLIKPGDLEHAFLFKLGSRAFTGTAGDEWDLSYRSMSCKSEAATVPPSLATTPGFTVQP